MKIYGISLAVLLSIALTCVAQDTDRKYIVLKRSPSLAALPFSDGVVAGNTLYIAGHIGLDPKTEQPPSDAAEEARLAMEGIKATVEAAGMTMEDVVSVQVFCSDVSLYDTFNQVYQKYFHGDYPARAFVGSGKLLRGARYEVLGIATRKSAGKSPKKSRKTSE
jgi:2-iminobutanoate/2-iminopropanoate deaminase